MHCVCWCDCNTPFPPPFFNEWLMNVIWDVLVCKYNFIWNILGGWLLLVRSIFFFFNVFFKYKWNLVSHLILLKKCRPMLYYHYFLSSCVCWVSVCSSVLAHWIRDGFTPSAAWGFIALFLCHYFSNRYLAKIFIFFLLLLDISSLLIITAAALSLSNVVWVSALCPPPLQ